MSVWMHVTGAIRVDGLPRLVNTHTKSTLQSILGPISTFDDPRDTDIPTGSEGSLQYEIVIYGEGMPWAMIPIWGDLRDYGYGDRKHIAGWIQAKIAQLEAANMSVRGMTFILVAEDKDDSPIVITSMDDLTRILSEQN